MFDQELCLTIFFTTDPQGRRVFITKNVKPSKEMIENLVKAVHGQVKVSALSLITFL